MPLRVSDMGSWRKHMAGLGLMALLMLVAMLGVQQATEEVQTGQPEASRTVGELVDGAMVAQSFTAEHGGLTGIAVYLGTYQRENEGELVFRLDGPQSGEAITRTVVMARLEDNAYEVFEFPSIRDSAGQRFTFTLKSPGAEPGEAITAWGAEEEVYPHGEAMLTGLYRGRDVADLTFRLTYEPSLFGRAGLFLERLAAGKPSVWGGRGLYVVLGGAYVVLVYALFVTAVGQDEAE
jgi:hypothetical protein